MGSSVKDAHLHRNGRLEDGEAWYLVRFFRFRRCAALDGRRLLMRYVAVTPVRLNGPACWHALRERSSQPAGLTHPQRARRPHMMSMKADHGPRNDCGAYVAQADFGSHCGWQSDPARSTASQRATLTGRVAPESPVLTVRASLSVCRCHGPVIWTALRGHVACSARSSAWPACTGAHRPQPQRWFIARWP